MEANSFFVHPSSEVSPSAKIGAGTKVWHFCHVMGGAEIGENCVLGQNVFVAKGVIIGNKVKIQNNVSVYEGVTIEDGAFVGPSVVFTNVINPRSTIERKNEFLPTVVGEGASIGANATIVCGNSLGKYSFIGAGAVVTKNVPNFALVTGNPGRIRGWVSKAGRKLNFENGSKAVCPETGESYELKNNQVYEIG
ncbi:MAG: hypothetical protein RJA52_474 [Bacteroidota bacterium]